MRKIELLCIAIAVSLIVGCNRETGQAAGETNADMKQRIESKINTDTELSAAKLTIDADAVQNHVAISGTVDSEDLQARATELAKSAAPGVTVDNQVTVVRHEMTRTEYTEELAKQERDKARESLEKVGDTLDDAWIHSKVAAKLIADAVLNERKVHVDVTGNVVTLRGTVSTEKEKSVAEQEARETNGVKRVINQLKVQP